MELSLIFMKSQRAVDLLIRLQYVDVSMHQPSVPRM